tara:strand:+ start:9118 stop:11091 length:1974 start_codon:yes stop_codon:yes gene_type:complete
MIVWGESKNDSFLFCLKKEYQPLNINSQNPYQTGIDELDQFLNSSPIAYIEPWLKNTLPNEKSNDIYLNRIYRIKLKKNKINQLENLKNALSSFSFIHSSENEFIRKPLFTPDDPQYNQQWFLPQINADDAWELWDIDSEEFPGGDQVLLASVDTGVDWDHVDLAENIWNNPGEDSNGNGVTLLFDGNNWVYDEGDLNGQDDDGNGYVDDLIGWDCSGYSGLQDNIPSPPNGVNNGGTWAHGTHVAGLLSASTNNDIGIASIGFNCSIMSVKVSTGEQDYPYITHGYDGIIYAAKAGYFNQNITIINNSWGGIGYSQYEQAVINVCHDDYNAVIVAAAGNGDDAGLGTDEFAHYPSSYENVISVCAMGSNDQWNHWATYHSSVDLASPGEGIRSTRLNNGYTSWSGSSMASPIAAGTIGLLRSFRPDWTNVMLEEMIMSTADPVIYEINNENYLQNKLGRGRVDALKALTTELFPNFDMVGFDFYLPNDNNNEINPGDYIEAMAILYNNENWGYANDLVLNLNSNSELININNSNIQLGDIPPDGTAINDQEKFIINISSQIPEGEYELILELRSNIDGYIEYYEEFISPLTIVGTPILLGDVNQDSIIDILDVISSTSFIIHDLIAENIEIQAIDMNQDFQNDIIDVILIIGLIID